MTRNSSDMAPAIPEEAVLVPPPGPPASLARRAAHAIGDVFVDAWTAAPLAIAAVVVAGGLAGYRIVGGGNGKPPPPPICPEPDKRPPPDPARWNVSSFDNARWGRP